MFGPGIKNNTTGFRCCAEKMVPNATTDLAGLRKNVDSLIGVKVPEFTLKTTDDKTVTPATWQGKVSYITFFASWCGSCKRELPELKRWPRFGTRLSVALAAATLAISALAVFPAICW